MPLQKEIKKIEEVVPPEAHAIAAAFRREAQRVRELAVQQRGVKGTLDSTWLGNSKNRFSAEFDPEISKLDRYADMLEDKARQIEKITITKISIIKVK